MRQTPEHIVREQHRLYGGNNMLKNLIFALLGYVFGRTQENPQFINSTVAKIKSYFNSLGGKD